MVIQHHTSILVFGYGAVLKKNSDFDEFRPPSWHRIHKKNFETHLDEFWYDSQNLQEEAHSCKLVYKSKKVTVV